LSWLANSEVVVGRVLREELSPHAVNPKTLAEPYARVIEALRQGRDIDTLAADFSPSILLAANTAAAAVDGDTTTNWLRIVERESIRNSVAGILKRQTAKLEQGEEADVGVILEHLYRLQQGRTRMTPLSEVEGGMAAFTPSYFKPLDQTIGGLPEAGLTIIAGPPGTGKTSLALKMVAGAAKQRKYVGLFTLEMMMSQVVHRLLQMENISDDRRKYILANDEVVGPEDVYALGSELAHREKLYMIVIDFADMMVTTESSEATVGKIYRMMAALAKRSKVPVVLLSQLNRQAYSGGVPKVHHIRWSGLAEAMASLILLIHNPNQLWIDQVDSPSVICTEDEGAIIVGKSRYGFGEQDGLGYIKVGWDGKNGWGNKLNGYINL